MDRPPPPRGSGTVRSLPLNPQPAVVWNLVFDQALQPGASAFYVQNSLPLRTRAAPAIQAGWRKFVKLLMLSCFGRAGGVLQGHSSAHWGGQLLPGEVRCYFQSIVSTSCGSGVIVAGCCRLQSKEEGREVSSVGRKVARLTRQWWLVIGLLASLLVRCFSLLSKQSLDPVESGKQPLIAL